MKFNKKRPRINRKKTAFKPNQAYINNATGIYLAGGGKITKIELTKKSFADFISTGELPSAVDEFLQG